MNGYFPYPQTLGRTRELNTVASDPNIGQIARPTQPEARSLFTQVADYVNNWLGDISTANQVKDTQSLDKAAKVSAGKTSASFSTLADGWGTRASEFLTIADKWLGELGYGPSRVDPGAKVPGRPPAPTTAHYQYANNIDLSVKDVKAWGKEIERQLKGLFNKAYEGPVEPAVNKASGVGTIGAVGGGMSLVILLVAAYVVFQ